MYKIEKLFSGTNEATYCPEDDKLRLYVGRVPREEYLSLKNGGWTSTPKQSCDFVAFWSPYREKTALEYAEYIGDEDQSPVDRATDRSERFSGYRDSRLGDAESGLDKYNNTSIYHGFQNEQKAINSAKKHERIGNKAVNNWKKAEYWTSRTNGVISNALYKLSPSVRQGRIKKIEAEQRGILKERDEYTFKRNLFVKISKMEDKERALTVITELVGRIYDRSNYSHPNKTDDQKYSLWMLLTNIEPKISLDQALDLFFAKNPDIQGKKSRRFEHNELRIQYESDMLKSAGFESADEINISVGGFIGEYQIHKVIKSPVTKKIISVMVLGPARQYSCCNIPGINNAWLKINVSSLKPEHYKAPTEQDILAIKQFKAKIKAVTV